MMVELLRLVALLGERDGHANMNPLSDHRRVLHLYPLATYEFADGVYVVAAPGRPQLVGRKLVAIDGKPIADVLRLVDPLVTYDNALSRASHRSPYLVSAEILHGLGITATAARAVFSVEGATDTAITPVTAGAYVTALRPAYPNFLDGMPKRVQAAVRAEARHVAVADDDRQGSRPSTSPTTPCRATPWRSLTGSSGSRAGRRRAA